MKILHIVEDYSLNSGGLRTVIKDLNHHLNKTDFKSYILSSKKEKEDTVFTVETNKPWLYSKKWKTKITELNKKFSFDVFHIHGVWMYPQFLAAKFCVQNNIPFLVSVHGMYEPWLWEKGTLKKKIYFSLFIKNLFKKANYLHAITPNEGENINTLFNKTEIIEIPNLIDSLAFSNQFIYNSNEKYILYLGRLDEKKGIDILLEAFSKIENRHVKIKIAGGINEYKEVLENLINQLKINNKVEFLGMVTKKEKEDLIKNAFVLVAPSHSEVIGMVNLEAAALKTPVITTYQTGLNLKWNTNGGKLINPNVEELRKVLEDVLNWSISERNKNGEKLYNFVTENYSWSKRFSDWKKLYKSLSKRTNQ